MAIAADGNFQGSVSGGCIEGEVIVESGEAIADGKPRTLTFGVADETAWRAGLPCGGQVRVLVERLSKEDGGAELLDRAVSARDGRRGLVIRTNIADSSRTIYERGDAGLPDDIANRFKTAKSQLIEGRTAPSSCTRWCRRHASSRSAPPTSPRSSLRSLRWPATR